MADSEQSPGPDFRNGVSLQSVPDGGVVLGRVDAEAAIMVRQGDALFAVGALCTHYHGALAEGLVVGDTVRCPLHHACFSLRSGEALRAPALDPITCWRVERVGDTVYAREKQAGPTAAVTGRRRLRPPTAVVIVGRGAAGLSAADMLRREGYDGPLTMISADDSAPDDRPNLSKDFLAGTAPEDWIPLRYPEYYTERRIDLVLDSRVSSLDVQQRQVALENGKTYGFDTLLIATGAEPIRLAIPGAVDSQLYYLRTFADSRAIVARAGSAKTVLIVGASFIGLEVAASLRARGLAVHVVAPDSRPLERVMGREVGRFIQELHEEHGVIFHLGRTVNHIEGQTVTLQDTTTIDADFVVLGIGVKPATHLAEQAGLTVDRGIVVNEYLETSAPGIFAAGDVARWPDPHSGHRFASSIGSWHSARVKWPR